MTGADGTEFYNIKGCVVQIPTADKGGKGMILGVMVEDFAKQFGSPKVGQTATLKTTGPENHEVEKLRAPRSRSRSRWSGSTASSPARSRTCSRRSG